MNKIYKYLFLIVIIFGLVLFVSCTKNEKEKEHYFVDFYDTSDNYLGQVEVVEGEDAIIPEFEVTKGYYYDVDGDSSILKNVQANLEVTLRKKMCDVEVSFYFDGELIGSYNGRYFDSYQTPKIDTSKYETYDWKKEEEKEYNKYFIKYTFEYTIKDTYKVSFYDGTELVDMGMNSYKIGEKTILPKYTKEGYEFIGWFLDDISLAKFEYISEDTEGDIKFKARFIETVRHEPIVLEEAKAHFTGVKKVVNGNVSVFQPVFPSGVNATVSNYDFETSDSSIATISAYSSISIHSSGCVIIRAISKTDKSVINGIFKTSATGVTLITEEEANNIELVKVTFTDKDGNVINEQNIIKGNFAYLPEPPKYDGYAFMGWDKDNFNILEDTTFNPIYVEGKVNEYVGKTISIIGDSISTFQGYVPKGYSCFYPYPTADVNDVNMTWWMQTINTLGAKLFVNNSYSGTCVIAGAEPTRSDSRLAKTTFNGRYADYLFIYMGSNDCSACSKYPNDYNVTRFEECYIEMLDKLKLLCPDTKIVLFTLCVSNLYSAADQKAFNDVIRKLAIEYNCTLVDIEDVRLNEKVDGESLIVDSAHPSYKGMVVLKDAIIKELIK